VKAYCPSLLSGKYIPNKHAHRNVPGGQNISPPVQWSEVPKETRSFVISVVDRHPAAHGWVHWFVVNLPSTLREIAENASGDRERMPHGALEIRNSFGGQGYGGPSPPKNSGPHEYEITVRALSEDAIEIGPFSTIDECEEQMEGKVLGTASVIAIFRR
jgi:Raf kinase inhibitor-like YbhB/YbcL family protein